MTNRIGDRPRFPLSNQRFDKGDAENIARYYEEIISRFTGSIYGQAWGCMSSFEYSLVTVSAPFPITYLRPKRCVLMYSVPADGTLNATSEDKGPWNAAIVQFDPARTGQPLVSLETVSMFSTGKRPWILFKRNETPTNTGNKAYWDTSSNTEQVGAAPLQDSEYVEFRLSVSYSPSDRAAGWHRCAYIDSWGTPGSSQTPVIVPIHWMDSQYYNDSTPPVQGTLVASALASPNFPAGSGQKGFNPATEMPALAKLLHWMAGKLGEHYSTASTAQVTEATQSTYNVKPGAFLSTPPDGLGGWLSTPPRGLLELHTGLQELEDTLVPTIQAAVNTLRNELRRTTRLLHTLYVTPIGTESMDWDEVTFNVVQCSATDSSNSLSPTLRPVNVSIPLESYEMAYQFVPLVATGRKTLLNVSVGTDFVLTSVNITANDVANISLVARPSLTVTQNYMTPIAGISLPPANILQVQFVIDSGNGEGSDEMRPFTVHIYGRNV